MKKIEIKKGDRYGLLTVIKEVASKSVSSGQKLRRILCRCDCGNKVESYLMNLRKKGHTTSCGCVRTERIVKFLKDGGHYVKHGRYGKREYKSWNMMKQRCQNPNNTNYPSYGGRGIQICESWNNFENFYRDMGKRPVGTSLGRMNQSGNYCPENCRWETYEQQNNNLSTNRLINYNGKNQTVSNWARELKINVGSIRYRLFAGWDPVKALTVPINFRLKS